MKILVTLKTLIIGPSCKVTRDTKNTLTSMIDDRRKIWQDETFGLLRILRLALSNIQFLNIYNWMCALLDLVHPIISRLFSDLYVIAKFATPLIFVYCFPERTQLKAVVILYIIIETIVYLYTQIIVATDDSGPQSTIRTFVMILIDYSTIILAFAYIYYVNDLIPGIRCFAEAIYFSLVAGTTTGFGDKVPTSPLGYKFVCFQIILSVSFLVAFFAYFLPKGKTQIKQTDNSQDETDEGEKTGV